MSSVDRDRVAKAVREIIQAIGDDPNRAGLDRTPDRVAEAYEEFFAGIGKDPAAALGSPVALGTTDAGNAGTSDAVLVRGIDFRSVCEHHLLPFVGVAHIAYIPDQHVVGLGRVPDALEILAARPQLQERLAEEMADALERVLSPRGVLVVLDAVHRCVTSRGGRQTNSSTVTIVSRGELRDPIARAELMGLIGVGDG